MSQNSNHYSSLLLQRVMSLMVGVNLGLHNASFSPGFVIYNFI